MTNDSGKVTGSDSDPGSKKSDPTMNESQTKAREFQVVVATSSKKGTQTNVLRQPPKMLVCYRMGGILFPFNRSFVRDTYETIRILYLIRKGLETWPDGKLAIFGHADYVGSPAYNKKLSERRSESIYSLLTLKESVWQRLYSEEKWDQDDEIVTAFKNGSSDIRPYMQNILKKAGLKPLALEKFCPIWPRSEGRKNPYMGCSEFNPHRVFNKKQLQTHQKNHKIRDRDNAPNRRVMVFLFDKNKMPLFPCVHSSENSAEEAVKNCDIPKNWRQNKEYKRRATPTFACKFYDSQVAYDCQSELTVPKLVSYPSAVILIKGYELGLRRTRYCALELLDEKNLTGKIKYSGLVFLFKLWVNRYYLATYDKAIKMNTEKYIKRADRYRKKVEQLKKRLKTVTDKNEKFKIKINIEWMEDEIRFGQRRAEGRLWDRSKSEYRGRISGSIMQDMWMVDKLSQKYVISSSAEASQSPDKPLPFTVIDWHKAVIIEQRGGEGFERPLLQYRAEDLAELIAKQSWYEGYPPDHWDYYSTEKGKTEIMSMLLGPSIIAGAPNGKGPIKRSVSGMGVVGFGEGKSELTSVDKNNLIKWVKTCISDPEMPYPPENIGITTNKKFFKFSEVCKKLRKSHSNISWRTYIFPAPSIKEWEAGKAEELTKKRAEYIGSVLRSDSALEKIVPGWGGTLSDSWAPASVDYKQVWKLAEIAASS